MQMQIDCHGSAQYKLSWHSLAPLVKMKTISTAGAGGGGGDTPYNGLYGREAPPKRGTFPGFSRWIYESAKVSLV